jgi:hypothetical protein
VRTHKTPDADTSTPAVMRRPQNGEVAARKAARRCSAPPDALNPREQIFDVAIVR